MWDQRSEGSDLGSQPRDQGSQAICSGSAVFLRDQPDSAVPFLWDQGPKFVRVLESRIRNLVTKMGSTTKQPKNKPLYNPENCYAASENPEFGTLTESEWSSP